MASLWPDGEAALSSSRYRTSIPHVLGCVDLYRSSVAKASLAALLEAIRPDRRPAIHLSPIYPALAEEGSHIGPEDAWSSFKRRRPSPFPAPPPTCSNPRNKPTFNQTPPFRKPSPSHPPHSHHGYAPLPARATLRSPTTAPPPPPPSFRAPSATHPQANVSQVPDVPAAAAPLAPARPEPVPASVRLRSACLSSPHPPTFHAAQGVVSATRRRARGSVGRDGR
jgi:hypothetical protein